MADFDGHCPCQFGPNLGADYQCLHPAGHDGWHLDQYGNTWSPGLGS